MATKVSGVPKEIGPTGSYNTAMKQFELNLAQVPSSCSCFCAHLVYTCMFNCQGNS